MMFPTTAFLLAAAAAVGLAPVAAQSTSAPTEEPTSATTDMSTVWMPPRSTRAGEHIYASVITAAPSSTELFLACTSVWRSASKCSQFSGVTLTYGDNTMKIGFKSDSYDCKRGDSATCSVSAPNAANAQSVLASSESAAWYTAITIVDGQVKLKSAKARTSAATSTGPAPAAATSADSDGICKRTTKGTGSGGSDGSGSGSGSGSSSDGSSSGSGSGSKHKGKGGAGGCSAASGGFGGMPLAMAAAAVVAGGLVVMFL
ncbi:hypothetical protein LZ30DRAFT_67049 [Colletotrichum cereale]|nr:hypothetical protein LZ30DRAFT_67049 [Colletotrichum cereale]